MNQKQIDVAENFHGKNLSQNEIINKFVEYLFKDLDLPSSTLSPYLVSVFNEIITNNDFSKYEKWKQKMEKYKINKYYDTNSIDTLIRRVDEKIDEFKKKIKTSSIPSIPNNKSIKIDVIKGD